MKIPELLSPCGNFEKMEAALLYGADAVYLAGKRFGMRMRCRIISPTVSLRRRWGEYTKRESGYTLR